MKFAVLFEWGKKFDRKTFWKMVMEELKIKQSLIKLVMRM
jgi:hypothetical protein